MKKFFFFAIAVFVTGTAAFSQTQFEVIRGKNGEKIMKGIISRELLETDTAFGWYAENQKGYAPDKAALEALQKNADSLQLLVFMGTWCEDSHFIIPRFFSLLSQAGFPGNHVTLVGVDRDKKTGGHLAEALNVTNVPTIIVLKKGKEIGRVVEYGSDGLFDKALGEVINKNMQ